MALEYILIIFLVISIIISFAIGANDETMAPLYGSRILNMKQILILAAIFAIAGAIILGEGVAKSVGDKILLLDYETLSISQDAVVMTILISTAIVLILSSALGLPISSTHATIGGIIGLGLLLGGGEGVNWNTILEMSIWWLASPIVGYTVTYGVVKVLNKRKLKHLKGFQAYERSENKYSYIILIIICITAFSRAGNDCSNAIGIVVGVGDDINITLLLIMTGFGLAAGLGVLGRIVIKNLGKMTELRPSTAFAVQVPTAAVMLIGTIQKIPLSGSHLLVASLVGLSKASNSPMKKGLWKIIAIWLLTFPIAAILSIILYFPIDLLI
ncbi:MAG TPA: inorganic phosphate transporter [Candidatus Nanopelagicaceae bacterium]|nr:inorganic phosphate transporter [Candidatus Nanopelagicaceae bacterium]